MKKTTRNCITIVITLMLLLNMSVFSALSVSADSVGVMTETFDSPDVTDYTLVDESGKSSTNTFSDLAIMSSSNSNSNNTIIKVIDHKMKETDAGTNQVLYFKRTDANKPVQYTIQKPIANKKGGVATLEFDVKRGGTATDEILKVQFCDTWFEMVLSGEDIYLSNNVPGRISSVPSMSGNVSTKIKIQVNLDNSKLSIWYGDTKVANEIAYTASTSMTGDKIAFGLSKDTTSGTEIYLDNVTLNWQQGVPLMISSIRYTDAEGKMVPDKRDGGKISQLEITAAEAIAEAKIYVALDTDAGTQITSFNAGAFSAKQSKLCDVNLALPATNASACKIRAFVLNSDSELKPLAANLSESSAAADKINVFLLGDSITATYSADAYPQSGIGDVIGEYLNSEKVAVKSLAIGGRSSKSFWNEEIIQNEMKNIKFGDYVLIKFGHNDAANEADFTTEAYKEYLTRYVRAARTRGAIPVFITPIAYRIFDRYGHWTDTTTVAVRHLEFVTAMREVAAEHNVALVDAYAYTSEFLTNCAIDESENYYLYIDYADKTKWESDSLFKDISKYSFAETNESGDKTVITPDKAYDDNCHLSRRGAHWVAKYIAEQVKTLLPLSAYVKERHEPYPLDNDPRYGSWIKFGDTLEASTSNSISLSNPEDSEDAVVGEVACRKISEENLQQGKYFQFKTNGTITAEDTNVTFDLYYYDDGASVVRIDFKNTSNGNANIKFSSKGTPGWRSISGSTTVYSLTNTATYLGGNQCRVYSYITVDGNTVYKPLAISEFKMQRTSDAAQPAGDLDKAAWVNFENRTSNCMAVVSGSATSYEGKSCYSIEYGSRMYFNVNDYALTQKDNDVTITVVYYSDGNSATEERIQYYPVGATSMSTYNLPEKTGGPGWMEHSFTTSNFAPCTVVGKENQDISFGAKSSASSPTVYLASIEIRENK